MYRLEKTINNEFLGSSSLMVFLLLNKLGVRGAGFAGVLAPS